MATFIFHPRRGLILLEVIIGTGLAAMLFLATCSAIMVLTSSIRGNDGYLRARQASVVMMNNLTNTIRCAKNLTLATPTTDGTGFTSLTTTNVDPNTQAQSTTTYSVSGSNIQISQNGAAAHNALSNVDRLVFYGTPGSDGNYHSITITLQMATPDSFNTAKVTSFTLSGTALARATQP